MPRLLWPIQSNIGASTARSSVSRAEPLRTTRREFNVVVIGERHSPARVRGHATMHTGSLEDDCCARAAKDLANASALACVTCPFTGLRQPRQIACVALSYP